ncbi:MAG: hypothetical protein PVG35_18965 [Desulfobacterales bacterium]|jgi:hypothetical protein
MASDPKPNSIWRYGSLERIGYGLLGVDGRGVEKGHSGVLLLHKHNDFGTTLDNALRPGSMQLIDDPKELPTGAFAHLAQAKLLVNNPMDDFAVLF